MFDVLYFKFDQNPDLRRMLLETMDGKIAAVNEDGSQSNLFWGSGVEISDMRGLRQPSEWRGENKLGEVLDMVRRRFDEFDKEEKKIRERIIRNNNATSQSI